MATFDKYSVGLHNVGSYQVSGIPWITGSTIADGQEHRISFPKIAKSITVLTSGTFNDEIFVAFNSSSAGSVYAGNHYISLADGDAITFNVKAKEIYIKNSSGNAAGYQIVAEITNIPTSRMSDAYLTGSGLTD
jgi:hypothetical protein